MKVQNPHFRKMYVKSCKYYWYLRFKVYQISIFKRWYIENTKYFQGKVWLSLRNWVCWWYTYTHSTTLSKTLCLCCYKIKYSFNCQTVCDKKVNLLMLSLNGLALLMLLKFMLILISIKTFKTIDQRYWKLYQAIMECYHSFWEIIHTHSYLH